MSLGLTAEFKRASNVSTIKAIDVLGANALWRLFTTVVPSTSNVENYEWLGELPGVKEFVDRRQIEALEKFDYLIKNRKWETTMGITLDDLKDNPDMVRARIGQLPSVAVSHAEELVFEVLLQGETAKCFDGQNFFASAHPTADGGSFANLITGAGVTADNIKTDFEKIRQAILGIKRRNGKAMFKQPGRLLLVHGPNLITVMEDVFKTATLATGGVNKYNGQADLVLNADIPGNSWYAIVTAAPIKPLILQEREGWSFTWDESKVFDEEKVFFGGKARYNAGYGLPHCGYKVKNS